MNRAQRRAEMSSARLARQKRMRAEAQRQSWFRNFLKRLRLRRQHRDPSASIVNRMTNWQRTQWARAGYPKDRAAEFASLQRRAGAIEA
jgi:hypothetical protein